MKKIILIFLAIFCTKQDYLFSKDIQKPNIIIVMIDDAGYGDYACLGNPVSITPNVDRFKKESVLFTQFHVSPSCSPTRSMLMTGRHEMKSGVTHTTHGRDRVNLTVPMLPKVLKKAGYATGMFGKWHLGNAEEYRPESRGYDEVLMHGSGGIGQLGDAPNNKYHNPTLWHKTKFEKHEGFCTDIFFSNAIAWMDKQRQENKPFFTYIPLNVIHAPHTPRDSDYEKYLKHRQINPERARYYGLLENADYNFGVLLDKLEKWGIAKNTIVLFLGSDNGATLGKEVFNDHMRGGKGEVYQGGTRVPLFVRWTDGGVAKNKSCATLTSAMDIFPTLATITGAEIPKGVEGIDLMNYLKQPNLPTDPERILVHHRTRWPHGATVEKFKYQSCSIQNERFTLVNNKELYDLSVDRGETNNVIDKHPEVVKEFRAYYDAWWEESKKHLINDYRTDKYCFSTFRDLYAKQYGQDAADEAWELGKKAFADFRKKYLEDKGAKNPRFK